MWVGPVFLGRLGVDASRGSNRADGGSMSYDLHITRKQPDSEVPGPPIALEEWLAVVDADSSLAREQPPVVTAPDGSVLSMDSPGAASWSGHPESAQVRFHHFGERVTARQPDLETRRKMFELAQALDARVLGDQGEEYGRDGN